MPGGANWNFPTITRNYSTEILQDIKARDEDALTLLGGTSPSNLPIGAIKYDRATFELSEWDGAVFNVKYLALSSGGTGAVDASGARTNLGIGTIATQNSNAVAITGGTVSGLTSLGVSGNTTLSGTLSVASTAANAIDVAGGIQAGSGNVNIVGTDGRIPAITSTYFADLSAIAGVAIPAGLIAMFDTACPVGWTRFSALDARFPRGAATYGATGGVDSHAHAVGAYTIGPHTHTTPGATTSNVGLNHTHDYSGNTGAPSAIGGFPSGGPPNQTATEAHTHGFGGTTTGMSSGTDHTHTVPAGTSGSTAPAMFGSSGSTSNVPSYTDVVWCKKN